MLMLALDNPRNFTWYLAECFGMRCGDAKGVVKYKASNNTSPRVKSSSF